jgi:hypothetical protein
LGELCLKELALDVTDKRIKYIDVPFIELNDLKDIQRIEPDFIGINWFFYKAKLNNNNVFIKAMSSAKLDWILKNKDNLREGVRYFFNEIFWLQKLADENLGPLFFGVTLIETEGLIEFALITQWIDGKTYKVVDGTGMMPKNPLPEHKKAIESILPNLNSFIEKYRAVVHDLQYMVDTDNRAWVIDPGQFWFKS